MADAEVSNVRTVAGSGLIEAFDETLLVMARRETGDSSMTLDEVQRWYHGQRADPGAEGPSRLGTIDGGSVVVDPDTQAFSVLDAGDFAAVDDLPVDLAERHRHGEPIDLVGPVGVGHYLFDVLARRAVAAMLTRTPADIIVLALGRT